MALVFLNTFSRAKEEFVPLEPGHVRMYTCGPTVYAPAHIGNLRAYMFEDLLRRYLIYKGFRVTQVMNLTDIDDKTIRDANARGLSLAEHTRQFIEAFFHDMERLNIQKAEYYPKATEHIPEMVAMVRKLLDKGYAYISDGSIYFRVASFAAYGSLSHMKLDQLKERVRVDSDEYEKETASDFALWKAWTPEDGAVFWETELGKGRPGWHIECSAMSMKYLGETFDIHTGGVDNIFPHHENEIAQSEAATGKRFANYWLHNEHLMVEGKKMAKSEHNFFTLQDIVDRGENLSAIRYLLISTYYRQQLNFTFDGLVAAKNAITRLRDFRGSVVEAKEFRDCEKVEAAILKAKSGFEAALDDDLNISPALAALFDFVREINSIIAQQGLSQNDKTKILSLLKNFNSVLGIKEIDGVAIRPEPASIRFSVGDDVFVIIGETWSKDFGISEEEFKRMINNRRDARKRKDFAESDRIRDQLLAMGIILEDTPSGVRWKRKL
jgi:cysteinyl-tRNA synthetase